MDNSTKIDNQLPKKLQLFLEYCKRNKYSNIGYPESALFDYEALLPFLEYSLNNCGDWSKPSNYKLNSFEFEKDVLYYFASLYKIQCETMWGYFTSGSTESNLFGCYLARERFKNSIFYYSDQSHYSIKKALRVLDVKTQEIPTSSDGTIEHNKLFRAIAQNPPHNPIIIANIGTTLTSAVDPIDLIHQGLHNLGFSQNEYHIHADAALSGMILPFVKDPQPHNFKDGIDSIAISGHKFIGSPFPYGIVLTKKQYIDNISSTIDYIDSLDMTLSGSRNGLAPLMLWYRLHETSDQYWKDLVHGCFKLADYAIEQFNRHNIPAWRHKNSITVVFPSPSQKVWRRYGLAATKKLTHLVITPHHRDTQLIDQIIHDVATDQ